MLGALIGAGASLLGGMMDRDDESDRYQDQVATQSGWNQKAEDFANKWNERSHAATERWNLRGEQFAQSEAARQQRNIDESTARAVANLERDRYRQDTAIRRKVLDARAAGLHPLYALGASSSQSPVLGSPTQSGSGGPARGGFSHTTAPAGQAPSGSFRGLGLGSVAMQIGQALDERAYTRDRRSAELRMMDAAATRDLAQAMSFTSELKRAENPGTKVHALGEAQEIVRRKLADTAGARYALEPGSPTQEVEDELGGFWGELHGFKRGAWTALRRHRPGLYKSLRKWTRDFRGDLRKGIPGYGKTVRNGRVQ